MIGASMAVRPPRSRGPVLMMIDALRRLGGSLWMVDNAFSGAFVDNVGTTPVTAVADLIGLITDKSYGGQLGPNLVTNGDFSSGTTGWTVPAGWALSSGAMVATSASSSLLQQGAVSTVGRSYEVEFDWTHTGGTLYVRVGAGTAATFTSSGRKRVILVAASAAGVEFYGGTVSGTLDNIIVRELTGNHATQSAIASKPSVQRVPKRLGPNLVVNGNGNDATGWTDVNGTLASVGGEFVLTTTAGVSYPNFNRSVALQVGKSYRISSRMRVGTSGNSVGMNIGLGFSPAFNAVVNSTTTMQPWSFVTTATATTSAITAVVSAASASAGTSIFDDIEVCEVLEWANVISFADNDFLQTGIKTGNEGFVAAAVTPANTTDSMSVVNAGEGTSTIPGVWLFSASGAWYASSANGTGREQASRALPGAVPHVVSMRWNAASISMGVDGTETSAARTGNCASGANVLRIGMYQGSSVPFNGTMHAVVYSAVDPDADTRKVIINGLAALQGRTL